MHTKTKDLGNKTILQIGTLKSAFILLRRKDEFD